MISNKPMKNNHLGKYRVFAIRWLERCGTDLYANINWQLHLLCPFSFISNLFWRLSKQQVDISCCWVCHGRFHGVLPKEHPGALYDVPWGLYKEMLTNIHGLSDVVTHTTNIWNKEYCSCCKQTFLYTFYLYFFQDTTKTLSINILSITIHSIIITDTYTGGSFGLNVVMLSPVVSLTGSH